MNTDQFININEPEISRLDSLLKTCNRSHSEFDDEQIQEILFLFKNGKITEETVSFIANPDFSPKKMHELGECDGILGEYINIFKDFDERQISCFKEGLGKGINVTIFYNKKISPELMEDVINHLSSNNNNLSDLKQYLESFLSSIEDKDDKSSTKKEIRFVIGNIDNILQTQISEDLDR